MSGLELMKTIKKTQGKNCAIIIYFLFFHVLVFGTTESLRRFEVNKSVGAEQV